ncbi:hypothetical protein M8818_002572 [Zalaria obscura]|uniref:Uncharacterized protein n=1 Tax=Zalaria obscura TaxID=2024903 RepID=A0ACC3SJD8_9PEZI
MFSRGPSTSHDVLAQLAARYDSMIATGQYVPFLYPGGTIGAAVVIAYLLIDHRRSRVLERCRYLAFAFVFAFAGYCILYCRARNPAAAFGVGLISAWSILWCAVMLVFNDAQTDFKRIERRERDLDRTSSAQTSPQNGSTTQGNGSALRKRHPTAGQENGTSNTGPGSTQRPAQREGTFTWQTYPSSPFIERMDWVADLFCNFRGMGWNWRIACLPPPPRSPHRDAPIPRHALAAEEPALGPCPRVPGPGSPQDPRRSRSLHVGSRLRRASPLPTRPPDTIPSGGEIHASACQPRRDLLRPANDLLPRPYLLRRPARAQDPRRQRRAMDVPGRLRQLYERLRQRPRGLVGRVVAPKFPVRVRVARDVGGQTLGLGPAQREGEDAVVDGRVCAEWVSACVWELHPDWRYEATNGSVSLLHVADLGRGGADGGQYGSQAGWRDGEVA